MRIGEDRIIDVPPGETKHRFERHWQTQRLVDAFAAMIIGERITKADLAARLEISVESLDKRVRTAKQAVLKEHGAVILSIPKLGFERLGQDAVDVPATKYLSGARRKALRARDVIRHGVRDWDKLQRSKKNELFALEAQAGVIAHAGGTSTTRKLAAVANDRLDFGRTLDLLKK